MFTIFLLLTLNFAISFWNASAVGRYWTERRELPGHIRFMMGCGVIMAACGFFYVYVTVITMGMYEFHLFEALAFALFEMELTIEEVQGLVQNVFDLAYLIVIFPVLGTGIAITANSLVIAYKRRDLASIGVSAWNVGAQAHNIASAVRHVPRASRSLSSGFKVRMGKDSGKAIGYLILFFFPIVISLGAAIATTVVIMRASDAKYDLNDLVQA